VRLRNRRKGGDHFYREKITKLPIKIAFSRKKIKQKNRKADIGKKGRKRVFGGEGGERGRKGGFS